MAQSNPSFNLVEATIDDIHNAYKSGQLTCRQVVQMYLDRIEAFDKKGPAINAHHHGQLRRARGSRPPRCGV